MPLLSIIIPTLNSAPTIRCAIESVLRQTFQDWELLILDGISTDSTIDIAKGYNDNRIKIHIAKDKGIYDAMNHGVQEAQGEWLYFLGSDDYLLEPTVLERMLSSSDSFDMVYGDVESTHLPREHFGEWREDSLLYNRCHQGIFYRRTVFKQFGLYPLKYPICADHYINLRLFLDPKTHIQYRPIVVAHYSTGGVSTTNIDIAFYNEIDRLIIRYGLRSLPRRVIAKHGHSALRNHCTHMERLLLKCLLIFIDRR